jgi:ATP-dependent RNA helicase DHX37/DHR1
MTDGILLKEIESDNMLLKYSVVIIDEAHERTINTDIILGFLSKVIRLRYILSKNGIKHNNTVIYPLRVVIMSATMQVDEFLESSHFKPKPGFVKVEARQYPVTVYHTKRTYSDHIEEAFKMICKIHRKLPDGGVLVFLTGKREINYLCNKLTQEFEEHSEEKYQMKEKNKIEEIKVDESKTIEDQIADEESENNEDDQVSYKGAVILPLYSSLSQENQMKVFHTPTVGKRLIVISTNVAETSLTIPNIRYVVDSGKVKKRVY